MPSPFHQKYSSQHHKLFGADTTHTMPDAPNKHPDRRASDASVGSPPTSPTERRRSSATNRFAALEALKRPTDQEHTTRRASLQDARIGSPGMFGSWWNSFTRGPSNNHPAQQPKEPRDTTTLRQ
ncbi:hypothetical protein K469DRAFT_713055 [Zopfia rhizophila CBS 207.26]|uniref:Conidiation-specific expression protein n=1 Tax=Zopfia rhizophila CBS 207.26 TaxID=1314779 RepID=A0A6A6DWD9_9PEZI|nr:hypothetical protein K469DRAFT_713055 [Zopfia rhizophila CBS 207.26]